MDEQKLSPRQKRFAEEYVVDHNATQAAIRAGYSAKTAHNGAFRVLANVGVQKEIEKLEKKTRAKCRVDAQWVIDQVANIAEDPHEKARDRLKALELLAKHLGLFERQDDVDNVIRVEIGEAKDWAV